MTDFNYKPKTSATDFGWYSLDGLPHLDAEEFIQFITIRLYDSLPKSVVDAWRQEALDDEALRRRTEEYVDAGYGSCMLREPAVAAAVRDTLLFHANVKYILHAWVIMPNHAHVLLRPLKGVHMPKVLHSIKSYSAQASNKLLGRKGQFWQHDFFDRYIRNRQHHAAVVDYIHDNPVKAGLCASREAWVYSSAYNSSVEGEQGCSPSR